MPIAVQDDADGTDRGSAEVPSDFSHCHDGNEKSSGLSLRAMRRERG